MEVSNLAGTLLSCCLDLKLDGSRLSLCRFVSAVAAVVAASVPVPVVAVIAVVVVGVSVVARVVVSLSEVASCPLCASGFRSDSRVESLVSTLFCLLSESSDISFGSLSATKLVRTGFCVILEIENGLGVGSGDVQSAGIAESLKLKRRSQEG